MTAVTRDHHRDTRAVQQEERRQSLPPWLIANTLYGMLAGWALRTWRKFLPSQRIFTFDEVDTLPADVQGQVRHAFEIGIFTQIMYWRPEGNSFGYRWRSRLARLCGRAYDVLWVIDPAIIGVIEKHGMTSYYPIAHWDPSGAPAPTIWQMRAHLAKERMKTIFFLDLPTIGVIVGLIAALFYMGLGVFVGMSALYEYGVSTVGVVMTLVMIIGSAGLLGVGLYLAFAMFAISSQAMDLIEKLAYRHDQLMKSIGAT